MNATRILDAGCFAGHDVETGFQYPLELLLAELDRFGVSRALVGSYRCLYQDVREGNREVAAWAARYPGRVVPLGILHPAYYGETPERLLGWLRDDLGFRVVGLFSAPAYYPIDWDAPAVRRIGEAAARLGLALQAGIRTEAELGGVARAWGDLQQPVMIRWMAGHRYRMLASEAAVAARCPDFLFDVGNLTSLGALEHAAAALGSDRLFFASNTPHMIAACPHALLSAARLSPSDRAAISGETVERALALPPADTTGAAVSVYGMETWQRLCARPKVDIHWHPDHWNLGEPELPEAEQRACFTRYGYERVIMSSILALNYDLAAGNAAAAAWCGRDPRVFGLIVVNPLDLEGSLAEIARYGDDPRFVGLKTIQDVYSLGLDDPRYEPILRQAAERGLPVMAHLPGLERAAASHPEVTFVATHANWERARELAGLPNVCFDFATGHALRHETQLARFVEVVGAHRVLFGSDGRLIGPQWSLAKLFDAGLKPEEETSILRANAYRVFPRLPG